MRSMMPLRQARQAKKIETTRMRLPKCLLAIAGLCAGLVADLAFGSPALAQWGNPWGNDSGQILHLTFDGVAKSGMIYERADCEPAVRPTPGYSCAGFISGMNGQAIVLGARAVVAFPYEIDLKKNPQLTITAWIKQGPRGGKGYIVNFYDSRRLPSLKISGGRLAAQAGRELVRPTTGLLPRDEWVFVAGVWDFDAKIMRLYQQDWQIVKTDLPMSTDPRANEVLSAPKFARPGGDPDVKNNYIFIGNKDFINFGWGSKLVAIDEVRVFNRALSDSEIAALRNGEEIVAENADDESLPGALEMPIGGRVNIETTAEESSDSNTPFDLSQRPPTGGIPSDSPLPDGRQGSDPQTDDVGDSSDSNNPFDPSQQPPEGGISSTPILEDAREADAERRAVEAEQQANESSSGETQTQQQGLQPAVQPHPVGPPQYSAVAGVVSGKTATADLVDQFMDKIRWRERKNRPCAVMAVDTTQEFWEAEGFACTDGGYPIPWIYDDKRFKRFVHLKDAKIGRIEVCNSKSNGNDRIKGIRIWGDVINSDGSTTYQPNSDEEVLPNCGSWSPSVMCPGDTLATGVVLYAKDLSGNKAEITGLQLICRAVGME